MHYNYASATLGVFHARLTCLCIEGLYKSRKNISRLKFIILLVQLMDAGCEEDLLVED